LGRSTLRTEKAGYWSGGFAASGTGKDENTGWNTVGLGGKRGVPGFRSWD